jgi:hypothetical protein
MTTRDGVEEEGIDGTEQASKGGNGGNRKGKGRRQRVLGWWKGIGL